ncbi:MAG: SAM-dependent DNA methyltransferase, partial [Lentisphaerales bacterium]
MPNGQLRSEIFNVVWKACDTFRGVIDPSQYKDYILTLLFVKYLSDIRKSKLAEFEKKYAGDQVRIDRAMSRERFTIEADCTFESLYARRDENDIGQLINTVLEKIEDANKSKLHNVFRNIDFNSESNLGKARQRNQRLKTLLEDFGSGKLDLRPERIGHMDIVGDVYEYLIARFAAQAGKKAGEFYTP